MKRNITLVAIFSALLVFTYFFEELGQRAQKVEEQKSEELFSASEFGFLERLKLPHATIDFQKESSLIFVGEFHLRGDRTKVKRLLDLLGALKIESVLDAKQVQERGAKTYLGESPRELTFEFENGRIEFKIGLKLDIDNTFYVYVKTPKEEKYAIVKAQAKNTEVYWRQDENTGREYTKLIEILSHNDSFFYNLALVPGEVKLKSVSVSNLRNRSFELFIEKGETRPDPFKGLEVSKTSLKSFEAMINAMNGQKLIAPIEPRKLTELIATMVLEAKSSERTIWEIYRRYDNELGPFLVMKGDRLIYKLGANELRAFFSNVQEFWDLRPLAMDAGEYPVTVTIKGDSAKVHFPKYLKPYFFTQAERVSERSADDDIWARHFKELLRLDFQGKTFLAKLYKRELMIENSQTGIRYYYRVGEGAPFPLELGAYTNQDKN